jgi:TRAP transporter TAXI family solute receptor
MLQTKTMGRWLAWAILGLIVLSLVVWWARRERLPWRIRIASGEEGGLYHEIGESLQRSLASRLRHETDLQTTAGSIDNFTRIQKGRADLAIIQGGSVPLEQAAVVTPLYPEWLLIVVRRDSDIQTASDLVGQRIAIGKPGSGMHASSHNVLARLDIGIAEIDPVEVYFMEILADSSIDASIITTGAGNRDVAELLRTGELRIVPLENAKAIEMLDPFFRAAVIPKGAFGTRPFVPAEDRETVATTSFLVASGSASDRLIHAALLAIHEENLKLKAPMLIARADADRYVSTVFHPISHKYFHPADDIGFMANVMETLAAGKELLFAIGAGIYLAWRRWRLLKERETEVALSAQKEHLDRFLARTLRIEKAQMKSDDVPELYELLNQVTDIKLQVLYEFTEEELRGDHVFRIFLTQCANLINKIQLKIISLKEAVERPSSDS